MVISPRTAHSFRVLVIRYDIVIVGELFVADGAFPVLLHNLPVQKLTHLCWRPEFSISSRWCGSSIRCTPSLISLGLGMSSRKFVWTESPGSSPGMPR